MFFTVLSFTYTGGLLFFLNFALFRTTLILYQWRTEDFWEKSTKVKSSKKCIKIVQKSVALLSSFLFTFRFSLQNKVMFVIVCVFYVCDFFFHCEIKVILLLFVFVAAAIYIITNPRTHNYTNTLSTYTNMHRT